MEWGDGVGASCALTAVRLCVAKGLARKPNPVRQPLREWCD